MHSKRITLWLVLALASVATEAEEPFRFRGSGVQELPLRASGKGQLGRPKRAQAEAPAAERPRKLERGIGGQLLWYLPNRGMDLLDIFRLRVRGGLGLSATVRLTDGFEFYGGQHDLYYIGLAESRRKGRRKPWLGRDQLKGLIFLGVDATDDSDYGPDYSPYECGAAVNLLVLGADVGLDPVELWDFAAGWLFMDRMNDDR